MLMARAAESSMRVVLTLAVLLMACHTLVCEHQAGVELDQEIQRLRTTLEIQQTELRDIEQRAIFARKEVNATSQQLEYLIGIRNSQLHKLRLEPYIIAPNSEMPMYADCIYIGLSAVFCAPTDGTARDPSLPLQATECEEVMLHVLERSPKRSSSNFSAIERVRMTIELNFTFDYGAPPWNGVSEINAHLCVVMPTKQHKHYQAALQAIAGNLRCGHEVFDPARPWSSSYVMPFGEYRMRPADGFKGTFTLNISFQVQDGTVQLRPLLAGATSQRVLACAVTQTPNLCDRESVNVGHLSSPLLPAVEHSERWHFKAPASSAVMQSAPPTTAATTSNSCFVAIVWTFWGEPPPYEMDWLSEVVDSSGCEAAHLLDLQMLCRGSLFSDSYVAEKFGSQYNTASKVFVVSYFSKDFARGFGLMESCMLSWHLDGFDPVLVHFGDDSNSYEYLRYPRLHFVIRNHPTNTTYGDETFQNILHLGIGYKIGFWPSTLRNISLRHLLVDNTTVAARKFSVSFAGQLSAKSQNRAEWVRISRSCRSSGNRSALFVETSQFNDPAGLGTEDVWVLCPAGFVHPETFRLYETLEAGALPVLQSHRFWSLLFAHEPPPFPFISGPEDICELVEMSDADTEALRMATQAWYRRYKWNLGRSIRNVVDGTLSFALLPEFL